MDKIELSKTFAGMVSCIYALAQCIDPEVNHVSMYDIGGSINVAAYINHGSTDVKKVLEVHQFENGELYVNDERVEVEA